MPKRAAPVDADLATWVVLLRGINVGGKNSLPMKDLTALCTAAGCTDVRTYIQSGNAVVRTTPSIAATLAEDLAARIEARLGLTVPVVLRSAAQLGAIALTNPLLERGVDVETLHVAFLAGAPSRARIEALDPGRSPPDVFVVRDQEVYLSCPNGMARTKLTNAYFDRTLDTTSTMRNWRTVLQLEALSRAG